MCRGSSSEGMQRKEAWEVTIVLRRSRLLIEAAMHIGLLFEDLKLVKKKKTMMLSKTFGHDGSIGMNGSNLLL